MDWILEYWPWQAGIVGIGHITANEAIRRSDIWALAIDEMIFGLETAHLGLFGILTIFLRRSLWR